jgi:hypothetical protein
MSSQNRTPLAFTISILGCLILVLGYAEAANLKQSRVKQSAPALFHSTPPASSPGGVEKVEDKGDFKLIYVPVKDKKNHGDLEALIKGSKLFDGIVSDLNNELALPGDVRVMFSECKGLPDVEDTGVENAWFDHETKEIVICYELIAKTESLFADDEKTDAELEDAVLGSTAWTFFHELGHALVSVHKLPITGKEEDAVDQLSTFILLQGGDAGENAALSGAEDFLREEEEPGDLDMSDSHSLSKQRFYNIICWIYGQNEKKHANLVEGDDPVLPKGRGENCASEYEQIARSWTTILAPYMKK